MPMSFDLPEDPARIRFHSSPLVEWGWAWHVLAGAGHHPEAARWVARVRATLPEPVWDGLADWSFAVRAVRPLPLVDPTLGAGPGWDDALAHLAALPAEAFAAAMLRPLSRVRGRTADLADPRERSRVAGLAAARGPGTGRVVRGLLDDPTSARDRFLALLGACWSAFFRTEWDRVGPRLAAETAARSHGRGRLDGLSPAIAVRADGRVTVDKVQSKRLAGRDVVFVPTVFGAPHVYVGDEAGHPILVHYPCPAPDRAADSRQSLRRVSTLANPARLEVCRAIALEPRSAVEIARLWGMPENAVTKHLSALRATGLVRAQRAGHFVRYSLDADAVTALGADLLEVLRR